MKLRLLLFEDCNRACEGCYNKEWDLKKLPVAQTYKGYDEIILTGGEPMLRPEIIMKTVLDIRKQTNVPIYLYTADVSNYRMSLNILSIVDGMCLTLHEQSDVLPFIMFSAGILLNKMSLKSLRLNVFKGIDFTHGFEDTVKLLWKVKSDIVWLKKCPLPNGEVFMRLK